MHDCIASESRYLTGQLYKWCKYAVGDIPFLEDVEYPGMLVYRYRTILWFFKVAHHAKVQMRTVYLAINYYDRYIEQFLEFPNEYMQLLAGTCLWVASKMEQDEEILLSDLMVITQDNFNVSEFEGMERDLLYYLKYRLHIKTLYDVPYLTRTNMFQIILVEKGYLVDVEKVEKFFSALHIVQNVFKKIARKRRMKKVKFVLDWENRYVLPGQILEKLMD